MDQLSHDQKLILVSMTVVVVAAFVERYSGVQETASVEEIIVGVFIATSLLLLLSYVESQFAVGLAVITALTMVIAKGKPFWDAIGKVTGKPQATPKSPLSPIPNVVYPPTGQFSTQPLPQQP